MRYGFYSGFSHLYNSGKRKRIPLPYADIYVKKGYDGYSTLTYFYFHGNNIVRLVEISDEVKAVRMTADDIAANDHRMNGVVFSDINWNPDDFVSEEEFERAWNGDEDIYREC